MIYAGNRVFGSHPRPLPRKFSTSSGLGLGVAFSDLPNGGHNLRLYTYDPPGSAYYKPPGQGYIYNTGHYDVSIPSGPCGSPDPQGFNDWQTMSAYAGQRGESLVMVSRADLAALCSYVPPVVAASAPAGPSFTQPSGIPTSTTPAPVRTGTMPITTQPGGATVTTTTSSTTSGSGGGFAPGGSGVPGGAVEGGPPLYIIGLAILAFVMLS